jgi:hypothetical protein
MGKLTEGITGGGGGGLHVGETRTIVDAKSGRTWTVHRTTRDYVYDLCDAYNVQLSPAVRSIGLQWYVTPSGELKLGDNAEWSRHNSRQIAQRMETERSRFIRRQLENQPRDPS